MDSHQRNIVLAVDDEQAVLRTVTTALAMAGFRAMVAENGVAGLECFLRAKDEICLVLSDIIMPVMTGVEMADKILEQEPQTRILLMSGYSSDVIEVNGRKRFPFIRKPFLPADLILKIQNMVGGVASQAL